jgi:hypothetical protein
MKKISAGQRGRKPGDGILKELDPQMSFMEKSLKLTHGRTHGNPYSDLVRRWLTLREVFGRPIDRLDKKSTREWARFEYKRLAETAMDALLTENAEWFQKMADAIEVEKARRGAATHPLHSAILELAPVPYLKGTVSGAEAYRANGKAEIYFTGLPIDPTPRLTIGEVCTVLEERGFRPAAQDVVDWQNTVRRACKQVGLPLLPLKRGRKQKKP